MTKQLQVEEEGLKLVNEFGVLAFEILRHRGV